MYSAQEMPMTVEELLIKQVLQELVVDYSRAVDTCDEAALCALFHQDGVIDSGMLRAEPEQFAQFYVKWVRRKASVTFHAVTNVRFRVSGREATGECYVLAVSRVRADAAEAHATTEATERDVLTAGRYLDRFQERDGTWKFLERQFVPVHAVSWVSDGDELV
jgi:hypothetical protein